MSEPQHVSVAELHRRIESGEDSLILDVRSDEEYRTLHARGAVSLPLARLSAEEIERCRTATGVTEKVRLYFICRSGRRAEEACMRVLETHPEASVVDGGTLAWAQAGLAVTQGNDP